MKNNSIIHEGKVHLFVHYQSAPLACRRTSCRPSNFDFLPLSTSSSLFWFAMLPPSGRGAALQRGSRGIARLEIVIKHVLSTIELSCVDPRHVTVVSHE